MARNILVLIGSPHRNGNSEMLADAFIEGAQSAGHTVAKVPLAGKEVHGCLGCDYCREHDHACCQQDYMQAIYPQLLWADTIVFACPVYYFGFPSQIKAVIDRFYADDDKRFGIKSAVLLSVRADESKSSAIPTIANYKAILEYCGWNDDGMIAVGNVSKPGDIKGCPALEAAKKLGAGLK